jgi:hypothetical protein
MNFSMRPLLSTLALSAIGFSIANSAHAGCGVPQLPSLKPNTWNPSMQAPPTLRSAYYRQETEGDFVLTADDEGWHDRANIVGMWRFQLTTPGANGVVVDDGYAQWHADGTEIQNSGLHAPITSNFCLGVWKQTGPNTYQLNHFPLAWDATGQSPANAVQLTETVKLTDDDHLTGKFTLKVYVWTTTDSLNVAPGGPVATIKGNITATRVTIDSTVPVAP